MRKGSLSTVTSGMERQICLQFVLLTRHLLSVGRRSIVRLHVEKMEKNKPKPETDPKT